jgi:transcriptional regulator with XRE-family HTH domain
MRPNLIKARQAQGFTQEELGRLIGLTKKSVSDLERNHVDGKICTWDALEDILKVPQRELRKIVSK